jgi:hypothetical protein
MLRFPNAIDSLIRSRCYPARISRMSADFLVQEGRIWHKYQLVVVNEGARGWNTQRVNRMMGLCGSISTGG